ncbi:hypothetical protein [Acinetobacter lactucae]|uniref:hypothetical protein n=1 Tax=Acinetobacter lactucae TaxID=1785128 RepID=UPI000F792318|nr:hypothetical protein [Acinetobacter lactucae]
MTNFAIEFAAGEFLFMSPNALHETLDEKNAQIAKKCHIYAIVEKPKVVFNPDTFEVFQISELNGKKYAYLKFEFQYRLNNELRSEVVNIEVCESEGLEIPLETTSLIMGDYPYNKIICINNDKEVLYTFYAKELAFFLNVNEIKEHKVLYIGQAFGNEQGSRNAVDRLKSHSTLQKILADCLGTKPNSEILIGIFQFSRARLITAMDGMAQTAISDDRDKKRLFNALDATIPLKAEIAMIEAALIRYFQPEYNVKLKHDLPSATSKTLQDCYKYDISVLAVNLVTEFDEYRTSIQLYSDTTQKKTWHLVNIELHDPNERRTFFSFGDKSLQHKDVIRRKKKK